MDEIVRIINNKTGFLFFYEIGQFMSSMAPIMLTFPAERGVFLKEENAKLYRVSSYFTGSKKIFIFFLNFFFL